MGVVWLARDERLGRMVAIKTLHVSGGAVGKTAEELERVRERAMGEARALAAIEHPNIASVFDIVERDGTVFVVMEYVPGESLGDRVRRGGMRVQEMLSIAAQVAEALAAAHAKGLLHRDLKPSNIQITPEGMAKVLDFGLSTSSSRVRRDAVPGVGHAHGDTAEWVVADEASTADTDASEAKRVSGTPAYMSPEQQSGEELDARSDIYAFGCVLYEMLTGQIAQRVLSTTGHGVHVEPVWDISKVEGQAGASTETVRTLLSGCLRVQKHERMRSAADAAVILRGVLDESRSGVKDDVRAGSKFSWKRLRKSRASVFVGTSVVAALISAFMVLPWLVGPLESVHTWYASNAKMPETVGSKEAMKDIVLIGFGAGEDAVQAASTLGVAGVELEKRESWRRVHAAMIEKIAKAKPKCITLDFVFPPAKEDPENTRVLANAISRVKDLNVPVVVGVFSWHRDDFGLPTTFDPQLLECGARRGAVLVDPDERSNLWKIELGLCRPGITQGNTSLSLETYLAALNPSANTTLSLKGNEVWIDFWKTKHGSSVSERATVAKRLPIEASIVYEVEKRLLDNDPVLREKGYELGDIVAEVTAPFDRAACSTDGLPRYVDIAKLSDDEVLRKCKGKFVIVGDIANNDVLPAPDGGEVFGVFSHIAGLTVLLSGGWVQDVTVLWFYIWVVVASTTGVLSTLFTPKAWSGLLLTSVLAIVTIVSCLWMPRMMGVWLNPIPLIAALAVGAGFGALVAVGYSKKKGIKA